MSKRNRIAELLWELRRQYPSGVSTWSNCKQCAKPARGGGVCKDCLVNELKALGVRTESLVALLDAHWQAQGRVEDEVQAILGGT